KRNVRYPIFDAFDAPDTQTACPQRPVSTHALQALVMLNSAFVAEQAKTLAARLLREQGPDPEALVDRAYKVVLARAPSQLEKSQAMTFLSEQAAFLRQRAREGQPLAEPRRESHADDPAAAAALVDFALAMFNRNELLYVP